MQIDAVRHWEAELDQLADAELRQRGLQFRGRARGGEALDQLLPEVFGALCVAARRVLGFRLFDVQIAAGIVMHQGAVVELATGEGKTLVAILPTYLNALVGKGTHVCTVNDYLARRDAEWMGPVYQSLGLTVGALQGPMEDHERAQIYRRDITYGTAADFGFDFLRDRLRILNAPGSSKRTKSLWGSALAVKPLDAQVQRGHHFALVDEADNIFIDEARTPLIIGSNRQAAPPEDQIIYQWADRVARSLVRGQDYYLHEKKLTIALTADGYRRIRWSQPPAGPTAPAMDKLFEHVEWALQAHWRFHRDQQYLVEEDKVEIIDENTGRRMPDRHWSGGLQQAVEAKEGVTISKGGDHAAQVTLQSYFRLYKQLTGMTGTIAQDWRELRRVYRLGVVCVPTNRPVVRQQWPDRIFPNELAKFVAVVAEVARLRVQGRPVLIGTRSVAKSEDLSRQLEQAGIKHQVLNARFHDQEAQIIAQAGQAGCVTIATNMAGRGTDIKLGPGVAEAGGLHVLGTERHESIRIDRQLAGRAGRQGDPGSCQFFLCLEDDLLEALGPSWQETLRELGQGASETDWQRFSDLFRKAQRRVERRHYRQRLDLLLHEKQRREVLKHLAADPYVD